MASGTTVVVGAAHGIGAAIARRVARETWTSKLIIAGISDAPMHALASELRRDDLPVAPCISKEVRSYQRNQGVQPMNNETDLRRTISW
jgi:NAD(P)-dependent dehydrogenase (short-subunit alcohol dehydrogenase family)